MPVSFKEIVKKESLLYASMAEHARSLKPKFPRMVTTDKLKRQSCHPRPNNESNNSQLTANIRQLRDETRKFLSSRMMTGAAP